MKVESFPLLIASLFLIWVKKVFRIFNTITGSWFTVEMGRIFENSSHKPTVFDNAIWAVKVVLITVGVVSSVILVKDSVVPCLSSLLISALPSLWSLLKSLLSPPYIYILLNFIILCIAVSSTFNHQSHHLKKPQKPNTIYAIAGDPDHDQFESPEESWGLAVPDGAKVEKHKAEPPEEVVVCSNFGSTLSGRPDSLSRESSAEVKEMIVDQPEPGRPGKRLEHLLEAEEEPGKHEEPEDDSFEAIWKSIMESKERPPLAVFKKCDSWDPPPQVDCRETGLVVR